MPVEQRKQLTVAEIRTESLFQVRAGAEWDKEHCESIRERMRETMKAEKERELLAPLHVLVLREAERDYPKGAHLLVGGHYRLEAAKLEQWPKIWALVREGTWFDAFRWSRGENRDQPKNRTLGDVKHAAFQAFELRKKEPHRPYKDKELAADLGVTAGRISQLKKDFETAYTAKLTGQSSPTSSGGESAASYGASPAGASGSGSSTPSSSAARSTAPPAESDDPIGDALDDGVKNYAAMLEETGDDPEERAGQVRMLMAAAEEEAAALGKTSTSLGVPREEAAAYLNSLLDRAKARAEALLAGEGV